MKSPLDRDVVIANTIGVATGVQAYRQGATPLQAINIGVWWRYWYKNATMSLILLGITVIMALNVPWAWGLVAAQVVINTLVAGITYASAVLHSGFEQRLLFRMFWPLYSHVMNVARFWWYLCLFLPTWFFMWINAVTG